MASRQSNGKKQDERDGGQPNEHNTSSIMAEPDAALNDLSGIDDETSTKAVRNEEHCGINGRHSGIRLEDRQNYHCPHGALSMGDTSEDISLNRSHSMNQPMDGMVATQNCGPVHAEWTPRSQEGTGEYGAVRENCPTENGTCNSAVSLGNSAMEYDFFKTDPRLSMNILPSIYNRPPTCVYNDIGMAEHQPSFRTLSTRYPSCGISARGNSLAYEEPTPHVNQPHNEAMMLGLPQVAHPVSQQPQPGSPISGAAGTMGIHNPLKFHRDSIESNEENISVSPACPMGAGSMTAQVMRHHQPQQQQAASSYAPTVTPTATGYPQSSQTSYINSKMFIQENSRVLKLPLSIITHVGVYLQCDGMYGTWKQLVERYGWNYQKTHLFESANRNSNKDIFLALLHEPEFQGYTLGQLREDLRSLPKHDLLEDLNEMIEKHNSLVPNRLSENQRT